jgi:hypothetical protein
MSQGKVVQIKNLDTDNPRGNRLYKGSGRYTWRRQGNGIAVPVDITLVGRDSNWYLTATVYYYSFGSARRHSQTFMTKSPEFRSARRSQPCDKVLPSGAVRIRRRIESWGVDRRALI